MTTAPNHRREVDSWTTVGVTALPPGWRNVYLLDGHPECLPCPALLLQELRLTYVSWDLPSGDDGPVRRREAEHAHEPPYDTRVVFAEVEPGRLVVADDTGNYLGTIGPDEDPLSLMRPDAPA